MKRTTDQKVKTSKRRKTRHDDDLPDNIDLLAELATLDEVSAYVPTSSEQDNGTFPEWCELMLEYKRSDDWPLNARVPLRRHDGELIIEVIHKVLHPTSGLSIVDKLWRQLDVVIDRMMRRIDAGKDPLKIDRGRADGLTTALAMMINPYAPHEDGVKATAMERYEARHGLAEQAG